MCEKVDSKQHLGRIDMIDSMRLLMAFFVVIIHTNSIDWVDNYIMPLTSIAVPYFFSVTGFFLYNTDAKKVAKQIKSMAIITVGGFLLCFLWDILTVWINGRMEALVYHFRNFKESMIDLLVFNVPIVGPADHLWYLFALLYALIILWIYKKFQAGKDKRLFVLIPILFAGLLLLGRYTFVIGANHYGIGLSVTDASYGIHYKYHRNFLFCGLLWLIVGYWIKEHRDWLTNLKWKVKVAALIASAVGVIVEANILFWVYDQFDDYFNMSNYYIFTLPLLISVWSIVLSCGSSKSTFGSALSTAGRKYSLYIFIFHPIVNTVLEKVFRTLGVDSFYITTAPLWTFVFSFVAAVVAYKVIMLIKSTFLNKNPHADAKAG